MWLSFHYNLKYKHEYSRTDYYRLDRLADYDEATASLLGNRPEQADSLAKAFDAANSPLSRTDVVGHLFELSSTINLAPFKLLPSFSWELNHEKLDYQRGRVDTSAVRNTSALSPSLTVKMKMGKMSTLEASYNHSTYFPELLSTIGYRDDSDPLNVKEGNPRLHPYYRYNVGLHFTKNVMKGEQSLMASARYTKNIATPGFVYYYNATTGAYRSHQENLRGGFNWNFLVNYDRALFAGIHIRNDFSYQRGKSYGVLATTSEGAQPQLNRQRTNIYSDNMSLNYAAGSLDLTLPLKFQYQRVRNSDGATTALDLYNYQAGLKVEYKLGHFAFSSDFNVTKRSGYLTGGMNRTLPIWNAEADWKVLKNQGVLSLKFNDILNKDTYYSSSEGLTLRQELWSVSLHNYVRLTFTYHFDAKVKE